MADFPALAANASKWDELDYLKALREAVGNGVYLGHLITEDLVNWVALKIRDDIAPDIIATLIWEEGRADHSEAEIAELKATLNDKKGKVQDVQARATQVAELANAWQERADTLECENEALRTEIMRLKAELYGYLAADLAARDEEEVNYG